MPDHEYQHAVGKLHTLNDEWIAAMRSSAADFEEMDLRRNQKLSIDLFTYANTFAEICVLKDQVKTSRCTIVDTMNRAPRK